jgi:hypothetical protein
MSEDLIIYSNSPKERLKNRYQLNSQEFLAISEFYKLYKPPAKKSRIEALLKFMDYATKVYGRYVVLYTIKFLMDKFQSGIVDKTKLNLSYLEGVLKNKSKEMIDSPDLTNNTCLICGAIMSGTLCSVCDTP